MCINDPGTRAYGGVGLRWQGGQAFVKLCMGNFRVNVKPLLSVQSSNMKTSEQQLIISQIILSIRQVKPVEMVRLQDPQSLNGFG